MTHDAEREIFSMIYLDDVIMCMKHFQFTPLFRNSIIQTIIFNFPWQIFLSRIFISPQNEIF